MYVCIFNYVVALQRKCSHKLTILLLSIEQNDIKDIYCVAGVSMAGMKRTSGSRM